MPFKFYPTDNFLKQAGKIKKVYPDFGEDLKKMRAALDEMASFKNQPTIADLGNGLFKYYLDITGKPASSSFGARVIFFFITKEQELWFITCYDKSDQRDLLPAETQEIKRLIREIERATPPSRRLKEFGSKKLRPKK